MSKPYDVLVIGGGIAGMSAAIAAAREGSDVILLEQGDGVGNKLGFVGDGRCNFTNEEISAANYYDADPAFVMPVLEAFSNKDLMAWFEEIGIDIKSEDGRIYPVCEQVGDVVDALRLQMNRHFVRVDTYRKVMSVERAGDAFAVKCVNGDYEALRVVLATGSKAAVATGAGEEGYLLAGQLGLSMKKPLPAQTDLRIASPLTSDWDGESCEGSLALIIDGVQVGAVSGLLEFTASGITGIPAKTLSRYASRALDEGKKVETVISFMPPQALGAGGAFDADAAYEFLMQRKERVNDYLSRHFLLGCIPKKLARMLVREAGIRHSQPIQYLKEDKIRRLAEVMAGLRVEVSGTGNFRQSQTCTGGVLTSEVQPETLEAKAVPGIYLAGDLLDVDGMPGGYSLQWAFSSGFAAGAAAVKSAKAQ